MKLKSFRAYVIKLKETNLFWTKKFFYSPDDAHHYFVEWNERAHAHLNWQDFQVIKVQVIPCKK
jgi:hypothetical protein